MEYSVDQILVVQENGLDSTANAMHVKNTREDKISLQAQLLELDVHQILQVIEYG